MPAVKRLDTEMRVGLSSAQKAWVKRQADERSMSMVAVIRELIDAERRKEAQP